MERVLGFGGFFFRAQQPDALAAWYEAHLGVTRMPTKQGQACWEQQAGQTVFAPFAHDTTYFGDPSRAFMLNFRVADLDAMVAQLRSAGVSVEADETDQSNGRFARLSDPEGNPIELWEAP